MSTIVIKDLPESVDLDRQAMLVIAGGARGSGRMRLRGQDNGAGIAGGSSVFKPNPRIAAGVTPKTRPTSK